jgi:hypothetical protein
MAKHEGPEAFHREFARLKKLAERKGCPAEEGAAEIDIARIRSCPAVFQPRGGQDEDDHHVRELTRALKAGGAAAKLDPVLVMGIGRDVYCVDGHHRLAAYRQAEASGSIPVEWFGGTLDDAVGEAIKRNSRDKLPMSRNDKLEAAWRLVVLGANSIAETSELTTISKRTVVNMRNTAKAIREHIEKAMATEDFASSGITPPEEMTWHEARMFGKKAKEYDDEWMEREAEAWAEKLRGAFGAKLRTQKEVTARTLEIYSPSLVRFLAEHWNVTDENEDAWAEVRSNDF